MIDQLIYTRNFVEGIADSPVVWFETTTLISKF